jgi:formate hydrogenlyase subunit 3/multisubunit Na+/H+ antiporter MnhD subunit
VSGPAEAGLIAAVAAPLALALLTAAGARLGPTLAVLTPVAALPALAAALFVPAGTGIELPGVLLGLDLGIDPVARVFLGFTALIWAAAGVYGRAYLAADAGRHRFDAFFLATMAGNFGLILAADVAGFYLFFSLMTLAAYGLVVHEGTPFARRAGQAYIVLAVLGEACLLLGFMLAAAAADGLAIADLPAAVAASPARDLTLALLLVGFGIKAGMVPLHVWLPVAHPAAPTPASAALSGAIIKAGIFGLLRFLPLGEAGAEAWGAAIVALGFFTAFYGVLAGLPQHRPKTVLAYSSLSQMGLILAGIGSVLIDPAALPLALAATALYATHHGLAKAGLFLGVGVLAMAGRRAHRRLILAGLVLSALAISGAPLTSGALAKLVLKDIATTGGAAWVDPERLLSFASVGTTLLMARFLVVAWRASRPAAAAAVPRAGLWLPWLALVIAGFAAAWVLFTDLRDEPLTYAAAPGLLWTQSWPVLLGALLAVLAFLPPVRRALAPIAIPEGDVIAAAGPLGRTVAAGVGLVARRSPKSAIRPPRPGAVIRPAAIESRLRRWPVMGMTLLLVAAALLAALRFG